MPEADAHSEAQAQASAQPQDQAQRIAAYADKLSQLKARSALREVMERELLLEFIRANRGTINEYPLLETQQNTIINLLCQRSGDHPAYEYVRKLTGSFIALLAHYSRAKEGTEAERTEQLRVQLSSSASWPARSRPPTRTSRPTSATP